jgi:hypothetical protein
MAATVDEQLYFATLAFRAARSQCRQAVRRAIKALPKLNTYVDQDQATFIDADGLSELIASLHRAKCEDEEPSLEIELDEEQKAAKLRAINRRKLHGR